MQGKIIKGIAGFYYVHVVESGVYECKAKGIFRKEKIKPLVGDNVDIEILDPEEMTGNITEILPRKNELIRPAAANVDQALVVFAVTKPSPHFNLLDRFLVMMESKKIPVILCFNKEDIAKDGQIPRLGEIYRDCGCPYLFVSAREKLHIEKVRELLRGQKGRADTSTEGTEHRQGAGEMAQQLGALTALPEVLSSIPSNHMVAHNHL